MANKQKRSTNIEKRRRLSELYTKGEEVRFNEEGVVDSPLTKQGKRQTLEEWQAEHEGEDPPACLWPTEDDIVIWVQPPDPLQREHAVRTGQAARARAMLNAKDPESREGLEVRSFISELTREQVTEYILNHEIRDIQSRAVRDVLSEDEWEDFTAFQDSMREWEEQGQPDGEEWDALIRKDQEYGEQVRARKQEILDDTREGLNLVPEPELRKRAEKRYIDALGNQGFMQSYEINMLYQACRDGDDHQMLFFEEPEELQSQPEFVQIALADTLSKFISDPKEAKNSPRAVHGSQQSVPPVAPETSEASTPEEQTV